jgi:hypothetical protein
MALEKTIFTALGVEANYAKITKCEVDYLAGEVVFYLGYWVSKEMRNENFPYLAGQEYTLPIKSLPETEISRTVLYEYLQGLPQWQDAKAT